MVLKWLICIRRRRYNQKRDTKLLGLCFGILSVVLCSVLLVAHVPDYSVLFCRHHSTCHEDATCYETLKSPICKCNPGFYGDGKTCYDLDECKQQTWTPCGDLQICMNTIGSYQCACKVGFYDIGNSKCNDIDECAIKQPCNSQNAICKNTVGSYKCVCKTGFTGDGINCQKGDSGASDGCSVIQTKDFPSCQSKVDWMKTNWKTHDCYADMGVDGSLCSMIYYLSEVETECPLQPGRQKRTLKSQSTDKPPPTEEAKINHFDKEELVSKVLLKHKNFEWMKNRISSMWNDWVVSYKSLLKKENLQNRTRKRILVYIGTLTDKKWAWAKQIASGGPLGELVQWSDLIASLYLLGHDVTVPPTDDALTKKSVTPCGGKSIDFSSYDLIYTDVRGLNTLKRKGYMKNLKCKLRVVDTFGTEPRFNHKGDIDEIEVSLGGNKELAAKLQKDPYGYGFWELQLKQFLTMFPHSPDNSFLGFAVSRKTSDEDIDMDAKEKIAVVYGKKQYMWTGHHKYLSNINQLIPVVGTVAKEKQNQFPGFAKNHGLLKWDAYQNLLTKAQVFIGLGFPFEGPAPLEAISKGVVFLNPKYDPPLNSLNDRVFNKKKFFEGKPTLRHITSQHPYMEQFVGKPHVYTLDISNDTEVSMVIQEIIQKFKNKEIKPYLPFEFTHEGMLQRLNAYVENQNFCNLKNKWPSEDALVTVSSKPNESCKNACKSKGLICDNAMFGYLNKEAAFNKRCTFMKKRSLLAPYVNLKDDNCVLQSEPLLFSCVDAALDYVRLCPCREYTKGQVALCSKC